MEKKYFEAPEFEVIRLENDIIATSEYGISLHSELGDGEFVGGRSDWEDEE